MTLTSPSSSSSLQISTVQIQCSRLPSLWSVPSRRLRKRRLQPIPLRRAHPLLHRWIWGQRTTGQPENPDGGTASGDHVLSRGLWSLHEKGEALNVKTDGIGLPGHAEEEESGGIWEDEPGGQLDLSQQEAKAGQGGGEVTFSLFSKFRNYY